MGKHVIAVPKLVVAVNYDLSVEEAVKTGRYDRSNDNITSKNFPSKRKGITNVKIILVHFNRCMESEEVICELDNQGLRPAELLELLALGAKYPNIQLNFPIPALGSVWQEPDGYRYYVYLFGENSRRVLDLYWLDPWWDGVLCRFASVHK